MTTQQLYDTDTLTSPIPDSLYCQKCDNNSHFTFIGEQVWSTSIAEKLRIQPRVTLWNCEQCATTLTVSTPTDL